MIINDENELKKRVEDLTGRKIYGLAEIKEDTTQYMSIYGGMVLRLAGNDYFVTGDATEGRFGIEDQPKFWVKYAYDLEDGQKKILKLVFREDFRSRIGIFLIKGTRSPEKEARVLELTRGRPNFMQGIPINDKAGNLVRILDFVRGPSLFKYLKELDMEHEKYFHEELPGIMNNLLESFEAIDFILKHGEHHGDIRNDHIIIDAQTGKYVWIDFDYMISHADYDIWCLGNVLTYVVGKGTHTFKNVLEHPELYGSTVEKLSLTPDDSLLFFRHRIANLKKLFPYISDRLNRILISFSSGTSFLYESAGALVEDIREAYP